MNNIIKLYYIIIEQFKTILKENKLDNPTVFTIGLHMVEHIFKFCYIYKLPQLDTCKKAIYYYIEFILQLKLNEDIKLSKLKKNSVCIFIYNKLFATQPETKSTNNLQNINILLQIINFHYLYRIDIQYLIRPLSKLDSHKLSIYNDCLPYLLHYSKTPPLFIKQHIHFIKLIEHSNKNELKSIKNKLFRVDNSIIHIKLHHLY